MRMDAYLALLIIPMLLSIGACDIPQGTQEGIMIEGGNVDDNQGEDIAPEELTGEPLFSEDFSSSLSAWEAAVAPTIEDEALTPADYFQMHTSDSFPSGNGMELSFSIRTASDHRSGGLRIKLIEKDHASNYASLSIDTFGDMIYYIEGHCVTPTPRVQTIPPPDDGEWHTFTFRVHTDGSAEWLQDGIVQFYRDKFDLGGSYTIMLSGSSSIGSAENDVFLDDIELKSLDEAAPSSDICPEVPHAPAENPCPYGRCLSNGFCCPSYIPYYCEGYCYASSDAAMSRSQGRCVNFRVIC